MADFQVRLDGSDFQIRLDGSKNYTATQEKTVVAEFLSDLADVSVPNLTQKDKFVLSYNATSKKYELISADQVLSNSAEDSSLPSDFVDQLDIDLDNRIDLDAGSF